MKLKIIHEIANKQMAKEKTNEFMTGKITNVIRFVFVYAENHKHTGADDDLQSKMKTEFR